MSRLNAQQITRPVFPFQVNHLSDQARGLVAWFPFGPNDPLGDMAHATVTTRTVTGLVRPQRACDEWPGALYMAGDDDYVSYGTQSKFDINASAAGFTVSCWVVLRITSDYQGMLGKGDDPAFTGTVAGYYALRFRTDSGKFDFMVRPSGGGNATSCESTTSAAANRLYHVVGVSLGATTYIYVNGRLEATASVTANTGTGGIFQLGRYASAATFNPYCLDGWLMDTRLYNRALSAADVWALYDPATRYDLYWSPWQSVGFAPVSEQTINPARIESAAQLFAPTLTPGEVTVSPGFLASTATVYAPTLTPGEVTVTPSRIESTATLYAPTITFDQTVTPGFISSGAQLFAPTVTNFTPNAARSWTIPADDRNWIIPSS